MYSGIVSTDGKELIVERLNAFLEELRILSYSTREEYQFAVISGLNAIFELGNTMTPLDRIMGETPALADVVYGNCQKISLDAQAIIRQILAMEADVGGLYNLYAAAQFAARQQIREQVYQSSHGKYREVFINTKNLATQSAYVDFATGSSLAPMLLDTATKPSGIELGVLSVGSAAIPIGSTLNKQLSFLLDGLSETQFTWNGTVLDLTVSFDIPQIINRFTLELDEMQGVELAQLTSSPDGTVVNDLLTGVAVEDLSIEGSSGKFFGQFVINFDPVYSSKLRIVIADLVGAANIALRNLSFGSRRYGSSGIVQSNPILFPNSGYVRFDSVEETTPNLTSITHQISYDGVQYVAIKPLDVISLSSSPFWYRAALERLESNYQSQSQPISVPGTDPALTDYYRLNSTATSVLGKNILERNILLDLNPATGGTDRPLLIRETILPGTLTIWQSNSPLGISKYAVSGNTITFPTNEQISGVTIRYQTSAYSNSGLLALKDYFSPRLHEFTFTKV